VAVGIGVGVDVGRSVGVGVGVAVGSEADGDRVGLVGVGPGISGVDPPGGGAPVPSVEPCPAAAGGHPPPSAGALVVAIESEGLGRSLASPGMPTMPAT